MLYPLSYEGLCWKRAGQGLIALLADLPPPPQAAIRPQELNSSDTLAVT